MARPSTSTRSQRRPASSREELDVHDPIPGQYTLEVSSPGLERPLRTPAHFLRAVGQQVAVRTHPGVEGERRVTGLLTSADDSGIVITTSTKDGPVIRALGLRGRRAGAHSLRVGPPPNAKTEGRRAQGAPRRKSESAKEATR